MIRHIQSIRLKAGALYLVTSLSLVIAITMSMVILLRYYYSVLQVQTNVTLKLIRNVESGWEYAKAMENRWTPEHATVDLFGRTGDTVVIRSEPWGVFHAITVEATSGNRSERQSGLLGNQSVGSQRYAIRLKSGIHSKLKVMENTIIKGDVMVPSAMVIPTFYDGKHFLGDKVVDGHVYQANEFLPVIDDRWITYIKDRLKADFEDEIENTVDSLGANSFFDPTKIIASEEGLEIRNILTNNIIVYSSVGILITRDASLNGVMLVAPVITIADSVEGCFQAIASRQIDVGNAVRLKYPSALVVVEDSLRGSVSIGNSEIRGSVILISGNSFGKPELRIDKDAHIIGEIFVQGDVQLYGDVTGSIACDRFLFDKGGEVLENALWNVTIDGTRLPKSFAFSAIYNEKSSTNIVCRF